MFHRIHSQASAPGCGDKCQLVPRWQVVRLRLGRRLHQDLGRGEQPLCLHLHQGPRRARGLLGPVHPKRQICLVLRQGLADQVVGVEH
jgi:hypothetical protein